MTTVTITEQPINVTVTETGIEAQVVETPITVEIGSGGAHGIVSVAADTHTTLYDSGGTLRLTLAAANPHLKTAGNTQLGTAVTDVVAIGRAPTTAANAARLTVATWRDMASSSQVLISGEVAGVQTVNVSSRQGFGFTGTYDSAGFNITAQFTGVRSGLVIQDSGFPGPGLMALYAAFSGGITPGSGGAPCNITDSCFFYAEPFLGTAGAGASVIGAHRGFWARDQGGGEGITYDGTVGTTVAVDIDAQTPGPLAGTTLTIRAQGVAPSIHQPSLCIGANAVAATSAILELQSTTGALLLPRMTTAQRDALTAVDGMMVYNVTTGAMNKRQGGAWVAF